jgi:hypothetical protein
MPKPVIQRARNLVLLLIGLLSVCFLNAQEMSELSLQESNEQNEQVREWQEKCESMSVIESDYFKLFAEKIVDSKTLFCHFSLDSDELYLNDFSKVFDRLLPYVANPDAITSASLTMEQMINAGQFPQVIFESSDIDLLLNMSPLKLLNQSLNNNLHKADPELLKKCDERAQSVKSGARCRDVLNEFARLFNEAQSFYSLYSAIKTKYQLKSVMKQWDNYLESSRSQTPLELLVNGYFYKKHEASYFKPPPNGQLIVLHPGLVIEDVNGAIDGENTKQSLMVEVIGYNWWQQDTWYLPSGFSYTRIYTDRAGVKDWGDGVSLHFRSQFTLGYSKHKDEEGIFISVDLLKLFEDKQKVFEEYKQHF